MVQLLRETIDAARLRHHLGLLGALNAPNPPVEGAARELGVALLATSAHQKVHLHLGFVLVDSAALSRTAYHLLAAPQFVAYVVVDAARVLHR